MTQQRRNRRTTGQGNQSGFGSGWGRDDDDFQSRSSTTGNRSRYQQEGYGSSRGGIGRESSSQGSYRGAQRSNWDEDYNEGEYGSDSTSRFGRGRGSQAFGGSWGNSEDNYQGSEGGGFGESWQADEDRDEDNYNSSYRGRTEGRYNEDDEYEGFGQGAVRGGYAERGYGHSARDAQGWDDEDETYQGGSSYRGGSQGRYDLDDEDHDEGYSHSTSGRDNYSHGTSWNDEDSDNDYYSGDYNRGSYGTESRQGSQGGYGSSRQRGQAGFGGGSWNSDEDDYVSQGGSSSYGSGSQGRRQGRGSQSQYQSRRTARRGSRSRE